MLTLLAALLVAQGQPAQDDPFETRVHNVEFLTRGVLDDPGENLTMSENWVAAADGRVTPGRLTGDALIALIRNNIAEDTWEHAAASVEYEMGGLTVTNRRSVQGKIGEYLDYWRGILGRKIVVDALIVSIEPSQLLELRAEGSMDRPGVLNPDQVNKLLAAAKEGKRATLIKTMRTSAHPDQRVHMTDRSAKGYIADYDVQVATAMGLLDPNPSVVAWGTMIDVRPRLEPFGNAITMDLRIDRLDLKSMQDRALRLQREIAAIPLVHTEARKEKNSPTPVDSSAQAGPPGSTRMEEPRIQLPKGGTDSMRTTVTVKPGEAAFAGGTLRNGRIVAYLIRPAVVTLEDKPAPEPVFEEQRLVKLYDISPLTRDVQDFPGQRLGLSYPGASGAALAGASFATEEASVQRSSDSVSTMIRNRIAPETWANRRNRIEEVTPGTLLVRQRPEVLKEIETFLSGFISARAQVITTEAAILGFRKGSRATWEARVPGLGLGGYFIPKDSVEELLKETQKGGDVRLVEWGEITSYPQQRAHVARLDQEKAVVDLEPQIAPGSSLSDPVVGFVVSGFILDVRPHFIRGTEQVGVELRVQRHEHEVGEGTLVPPGIGPLQLPSETSFGRVSTIACKEGHWTLVAVESRGAGDGAEDWVLVVRARPNLLK